jgi:Beta-propeller repeat
MQTKSPLVRIGIMAGIPIAALALFLSVHMHHRAHPSQLMASYHTAALAQPPTPLSAAQKQNFTSAYGNLPLAFEANEGQTAPPVHYIARGPGYQLFLTNQEAVLTLRHPAVPGTKATKGASLLAARSNRKPASVAKTSILRMHFDGANPAAEIVGAKSLPGKTNYFVGNDPKKWHTDVPSFEAVRYRGIYPGVDLLFYGHQQRLEYDFIVAPGADPQAIALSISGARKLGINSQGDVLMSVADGKVALQKPVVYQEVNGQRREIAGNYTIASDHQIRFAVAAYDRTQPLTIDPVLNYSTYIGGEFFDQALGIALDTSGDAYIAGLTQSTKFPQMDPISTTSPGDDSSSEGTAFVSELNPTGTALLYSTYLGGSGNGTFGDGANAIAVDTATPPNIYVTGFTGSPDFPVSTVLLPFQGQPGPASTALANGGSAFITKLAPAASGLSQLVYSSYLGGNTFDEGFGIAVDGSGNAYIAGATASSNFPQQGTQITAVLTSPNTNAFLTKINTTASGAASLVYSTYLGGSGTGSGFLDFGDVAFAVTIDSSSDAYLVGGTTSTDFPTAGTAIAGSAACGANTMSSAFVSEINTIAQTLTFSHCLSGNTYDLALGVSLGTGVPAVATGIAYITGTTGSSNFPLSPVPGTIPPAGTVAHGVAFVSLLNTANGTLQYSTYLGGTNSDTGYAISSDSSGNAYVTGQTSSADFPITQGALVVARNNPTGVGFVSKISPNGNGLADLVYSSYFGGQTVNTFTTQDSGRGIAVSGTNAYITGQMTSADMPVSSGAFQASLGAAGATNAYVADLPLVPTISVSPTSIAFGIQLVATPSQPQYVMITNNTLNPIGLTLPPTSTNPDFAGTASGSMPCATPLAGGASCTIGVIFTPAIAGAVSGTLNIVDALDGPAHPMQVALTGTGSANAPNITLSPTSLTLPGALLTTTSGPLPVSIGNSGNLPLSISAISAGTGVFTESSASCNGGNFPIVIAPGGAACMVQVSFSPSATTTPGPVTGALTITQTGGNVSTVPLTGTAWDFSASAAAISVAKGATGSFPVVVTGLGGFTGAVAFTCTPGMLITSCSVPTTNAAPAPGATASGAITASSFIVPPQSMKVPPSALLRQVLFIMLAIGLLFMLPDVRRFRTRLGMLGAMLVLVLVAGCSGGGGGSKSSTLTITPSSGGVTKTAITVNVTITQ